MRYLISFRRPAHAVLYDMRHSGVIAPEPGVTDYIADSAPPMDQLAKISEYVEPDADPQPGVVEYLGSPTSQGE